MAPGPSRGSPYEVILGQAFGSLHPHVQRAHLPPLGAEGLIDVEHGQGWLAQVMIRLMNLPAVGVRQSVELDVTGNDLELVWMRRIGNSTLRTRQRAVDSRIEERSGLGRVSFDLAVEDGSLRYRQASFHIAGLPVPASLAPGVGAIVAATADGWHVDVTVEWRGALLCRYAGAMHAS